MISAKQFATTNASFWRSSLPQLDSFVRALNTNILSFGPSVRSRSDAERHDFIGETGFLLLGRALSNPGVRLFEMVQDAEGMARERALALRSFRAEVPGLTPQELGDAVSLAQSSLAFLDRAHPGDPVLFEPILHGCGIVDVSQADLIAGRTLYEFKTVERAFRGADVRQLVLYAALNHEAGLYQVERLGLVNPRRGSWVAMSSEQLAFATSGASPAQLYGTIADFLAGRSVSVSMA